MTLRGQGSRFAWLMTGAAIGTTVVLVLALVIPFAREALVSIPLLLVGVLCAVLLGGLLGLVPGVRELEVTAARSMLGVRSELVVPQRPGLVHRVQDVLWVQLHLLLGLVAAACLTMLLPAAAVTLAGAAGLHSGLEVVPVPAGAAGRSALGALALGAILTAVLAAWPLGALAASLAPRLLGPTARDRLAVALDRAEREAEHLRIARDLHDGIGHSLTIVSIQAAAGGRVLDRDPEAARDALARIEATARDALVELDGVLATLRDEPLREAGAAEDVGEQERSDRAGSEQEGSGRDRADGPAAPAVLPPLETVLPRIETVLEDHRRAGMALHVDSEALPELPAVQGEHLARVVTELLTNAHRHGGEGPVTLRIRTGRDEAGERAVVVEAENLLATPADAARPAHSVGPASSTGPAPSAGAEPTEPSTRRTGGRGLSGLRERLALSGGTMEAGPHENIWRARAVVPILLERP